MMISIEEWVHPCSTLIPTLGVERPLVPHFIYVMQNGPFGANTPLMSGDWTFGSNGYLLSRYFHRYFNAFNIIILAQF